MLKHTICILLFVGLLSPYPGGWAQSHQPDALYAEGLYSEVIEALPAPQSAAEWMLKGDALHKLEDFSEALEAYNTAEKAGETTGALYLHRGICHVSLNRYSEATADLGRAHERLPEEKRVPYYFAAIAYGERNERQALAYLEDALKLDPVYFEALYLKGAALYELRRFKEAREVFALCRTLKPEDDRTRLNHAMVSIELGRYGDALEALDELVNSEDDLLVSEAYYQRGATLYNLRRAKEACEDWANAAALGDKDAQILTETVCMTNKKKRAIKRKQVYVAF